MFWEEAQEAVLTYVFGVDVWLSVSLTWAEPRTKLIIIIITVQHVSAYTVVRAIPLVNGAPGAPATWGCETPEPLELKLSYNIAEQTDTAVFVFSFLFFC